MLHYEVGLIWNAAFCFQQALEKYLNLAIILKNKKTDSDIEKIEKKLKDKYRHQLSGLWSEFVSINENSDNFERGSCINLETPHLFKWMDGVNLAISSRYPKASSGYFYTLPRETDKAVFEIRQIILGCDEHPIESVLRFAKQQEDPRFEGASKIINLDVISKCFYKENEHFLKK